MAEIGIIASVIGVAGAGFRLSLILNAVGSEVASAGIEIHTISKGVTLFSLMLKQVGHHLQTPDSIHSQEALDTVKQITEECQLVFDEISDMLDRVQTRKADGSASPTIQQRFKWCFKKHRVTYLLAQLESLKMSLLVMLQILQLGKLMAIPPRSEAKEDAAIKDDIVQQERAETQNIVIVRYWAITRLDRLYYAAEQEDREDRQAEMEVHAPSLLENGQKRLSIEGLPSPTSNALVRLPVVSLGELDQALHRIKESPRDMIQVSDSVIDPLLNRWTRWHEILQRRTGGTGSRPNSRNRYAPSVDDLYEADEEHSAKYYQQDFDGSEPGRERGFYLEGTTTNWREPHSEAARRDARRLRHQYAGFQPSVDEEGEEVQSSRRPAPSRHVIDSSSSSGSETDSDYDKSRYFHGTGRRRSSASTAELKQKRDISGRQPYTDGTNLNRYASSPSATQTTPRSTLGTSLPSHASRPHPHHTASSPLVPPLHTGNVSNPYQQGQTNVPPAFGTYPGPGFAPRHMVPQQPQRMPHPPPRPLSSDGKTRSPSRAMPSAPVGHSSYPTNSTMTEDERRLQQKRQHNRNIRKGATRGLLGAGAIAGFLEALEGLSI